MKLTIEQALKQGVTLHKEGMLQDAERLYRIILQSQPKHPDANHNLGLIALSMNKLDEALILFETALKANPKIEQFWLSYIDTLIKEKQFNNARQVLEQAKKQDVDGDRLNFFEVKLSTKTQKQNTKRLSPPKKIRNSLLEHYQNGRFSDAEKLALEITQDFPKHQFAWKILGVVLGVTGRKSEAVDAYQTAVVLSPQDAEAHYNLGIALQELGRLDEAEASYTQAIALKPDLAEAHYNLGNTLKELGRLDEAEASYSQAIALKPDFAEAYNNLGATLQELRRLDEAEDSYSQAIALKPDYASALINRWQLLFDKKEFDAALRDIDLCNTEKSRACSLETLYALGRIEEIYKRIGMQAEIDDGNIRMAAFSSFISEREKRNTAHEFCRNPQSFIHFSNISSHLEDSSTFITGVIEELNKTETIWEPNGKTTVKGFQTLKHINVFANPSGKMKQLKSIILNELDAYYLKFQSEQCSYIQKFPTTRNPFGWAVILKQQGHQEAHIHTSGWLSGVIYLKVVPSLGKDEGAIEFSLNGKNYSDSKSPKLLHQPAQGDIVFFPSSLHHRTIPFTTDTDRITVSFDLMPRYAEAAKH
tara:strand:- start:161 stop:1933 length:1773 start_codon:yes stop_codon:yes gene_type:complete